MIKQFKPMGYLYHGGKIYYAISVETIQDNLGWVAVDCIPTNVEFVEDLSIPMVYNAPVFLTGGAFVTKLLMPDVLNCQIEGEDIDNEVY